MNADNFEPLLTALAKTRAREEQPPITIRKVIGRLFLPLEFAPLEPPEGWVETGRSITHVGYKRR